MGYRFAKLEWFIDLMEYHILPSIFAIAAKIVLFFLGRHSLRSIHPCLLTFLASLFGVNIFELALFYFVDNPQNAYYVLAAYYACAVSACASLFCFGFYLKGSKNSFVCLSILAISIVAVMVTFVPGLAIEKAVSIGYSVSREPGPFYWILQISIVVPLVGALYIFGSLVFSSDDNLRSRGLIMLLGTSPLVIVVVGVVAVMQLGAQVNAVIFVSLSTSFMMLILMVSESQHGFFKLLSWVPSTQQNHHLSKFYEVMSQNQNVDPEVWATLSKLINKKDAGVDSEFVPRLVELVTEQDMSLADAKAEFAKIYVESMLSKTEGNKSEAARRLGKSVQTIRRTLEAT